MEKKLFFVPGRDFPVILAPMAGVTDMSYRAICRELGADFSYTEMISAKGLFYGGEQTKKLLRTAPSERPCGVQLFGSEPGIMADMAGRVCEEYAGEISLIDINMGCPARKIVTNGDGSALMLDVEKAAAVIRAVAGASTLPVTVKFRKGFDDGHVNAVEFAQMAEESGAAMLAVHGRTRAQMYSGRADWDIIARVVKAVDIPVIGNGDVFSGADAVRMREVTGCAGIMLGRGAQGNPFIFPEIKAALNGEAYEKPTAKERIDAAKEHARRLVAAEGEGAIIKMRKHVPWYLSGLRGSANVRAAANGIRSIEELFALLDTLL